MSQIAFFGNLLFTCPPLNRQVGRNLPSLDGKGRERVIRVCIVPNSNGCYIFSPSEKGNNPLTPALKRGTGGFSQTTGVFHMDVFLKWPLSTFSWSLIAMGIAFYTPQIPPNPIGVKLRRSIIAGLWISDSGISQVEFFFNVFWVDWIIYGLVLTLFGMSK